MHVFWLKGFQRTTPQDLLNATGLSRSSLYNTFGSKQGLFVHALQAYTDSQAAGMRQMLASGSLRHALARMYDRLLDTVTATEGPNACLICMTSLGGTDDGDVAARLRDARQTMEGVFLERLQAAQAAGDLGPDKPVEALARLVFTTNMGLVTLARAGATRDELAQVVDLTLETICD
jgi:TetR/AcrR family transcriptional repressor of nem operon